MTDPAPVFPPLPADRSFPQMEEEILALWERIGAFERQVQGRPADKSYVFYDGPPFATGLPHYGHLVASTLKDIVPRYWAMRGWRVERRFGWDTHGVPIEMEMEKQLGLSGPASVREHGVAAFNEACRAGVLRYAEQWRKVIGRLGRWVDFDNDYKTMDASFMESVWWVFRQLWDKGLVYEDQRVMPFSTRLSTSLSNFEANLDYRDVQDPAVTVRVRRTDGDGSLLIWTTTPWTLPSNLAVAVGPELDYVQAVRPGDPERFVVAAALRERVLGADSEVVAQLSGADLLGLTYEPLFPYYADLDAFRVIAADHVTTEDGTGLVHMAPGFGEEDFHACRREGLPVVDPVDEEGRFGPPVTDYAGRHVKECDRDIIRRLKDEGLLLHQATIDHSYPHCWRSGTPLIYKTVSGWFVRVTELRDRMVELNRGIHWVPEAVGAKRFGNWLADARDWNVSRSRFWGTPIPLWRCETAGCGHVVCIGGAAELEARVDEPVPDLHSHRIDHHRFACQECGTADAMVRVRDVFDCWFESGAMPYAQFHYPFEDPQGWEASFPAQFIAEGLDQTRGWFYTLLVLSTAINDQAPFSNCIVNGMVLAEDGSKMSKSKRNYPDPTKLLDEHGADALRACLINSPVVRAEPLRFSEAGVRDVVRTVLLPLHNAWSFFVQYANADGWSPADERPAAADRPELDRWILSVLQSLIAEVNEQMQGYYLYRVVPPMLGFIDHLTNWYIRRSRRRFWRPADSGDAEAQADKAAAYATLYEVLVEFAKVTAPVLPFISDAVYQNLVVAPGQQAEGLQAPDSVHLCDYPLPQDAVIDPALEADVAHVRAAVGLGRALRERHQLKTRQPLATLTVVHHDPAVRAALLGHASLIAEELNVKAVHVTEGDADLCDVTFKANFRALGPRVGKEMKRYAAAIAAMSRQDWERIRASDDGGADVGEGLRVEEGDILVTRTPRGDVVIETDAALTVALDTELDDDLRSEGLARDAVRRLQQLRKDSGLAFTDRIQLRVHSDDPDLGRALLAHQDYLAEELLATSLTIGPGAAGEELDVDGRALNAEITQGTP